MALGEHGALRSIIVATAENGNAAVVEVAAAPRGGLLYRLRLRGGDCQRPAEVAIPGSVTVPSQGNRKREYPRMPMWLASTGWEVRHGLGVCDDCSD